MPIIIDVLTIGWRYTTDGTIDWRYGWVKWSIFSFSDKYVASNVVSTMGMAAILAHAIQIRALMQTRTMNKKPQPHCLSH